MLKYYKTKSFFIYLYLYFIFILFVINSFKEAKILIIYLIWYLLIMKYKTLYNLLY